MKLKDPTAKSTQGNSESLWIQSSRHGRVLIGWRLSIVSSTRSIAQFNSTRTEADTSRQTR